MKGVVRLLGMILVGLMAMSLLSGCASKTLMESRPAGAEVTVDGEYYIGETPVEVRELPWRGATRHYQFEKEGYHTRVMQLSAQNNSRHVAACVCTLGIFWPLLLFGEYPDDLVVVMDREQAPPRAQFSDQPRVSYGH